MPTFWGGNWYSDISIGTCFRKCDPSSHPPKKIQEYFRSPQLWLWDPSPTCRRSQSHVIPCWSLDESLRGEVAGEGAPFAVLGGQFFGAWAPLLGNLFAEKHPSFTSTPSAPFCTIWKKKLSIFMSSSFSFHWKTRAQRVVSLGGGTSRLTLAQGPASLQVQPPLNLTSCLVMTSGTN